MPEAMELEWRDVDLVGPRAIFWVTKNRVVQALAELPRREGVVFLANHGRPYTDRRRRQGGQITNGWRGAIRRAGLNPSLLFAPRRAPTDRSMLATNGSNLVSPRGAEKFQKSGGETR